MEDCLFCSIAAGLTDTKLIWENEVAAAFRDLNPEAPVHLLVVPKSHVDSLDHLHDTQLGGQLLEAVQRVAELENLTEGYRVQINVGRAGGQVIDHLHIHVKGTPKTA